MTNESEEVYDAVVSGSGVAGAVMANELSRAGLDHAYLLAWGLMPEVVGTMRGTGCTSGIADLRGGSFRARQAAFGVDIRTDGWGWAGGGTGAQVRELVDRRNACGAQLRRGAVEWISRQLLLVGAGGMPSIGSANTTLTLTALCLRSAETIVGQLRQDDTPATIHAPEEALLA